jgi:hypothetical protein
LHMSAHELSRSKKRAVEALATTKTIVDAADLAGVGRRSIYDWMENDPVFKAAVLERENQNRDAVGRILAMGAPNALEALERIIDNPDHPGHLTAIRIWLDYLVKTKEMTTIEIRLTRLEQARLTNGK